MPRTEAVIFDLGGCLVDSEVHSLAALAAEMQDAGMSDARPERLRHRFLGVSLAEICAHLAVETGRPCPAGFADRFEQRLMESYEHGLSLIDGALELLDTLTSRGIRVAIATCSSTRRMNTTLQRTGLINRFGHTAFSADLVECGKPAPDLFQLVAARLGIAPEACVVLEDAPHGIAGAVAADMRAIGFVGGTHLEGSREVHAEKLRMAGAETVLYRLSQMQGALLGPARTLL